MARRFGVRTPDVLVLPIGGVARLERIPEEPKQEFLIAIAGPAVTLAIVVVLYLLLRVTDGLPASGALHADDAFLPFLMKSNLLLFFFNLAPAFPMDGGRVLRAALSSRLGLVKGTRIAARLGQFFAVTGGIYAYNKGEPILVLIAFFIFLSAGSEAVAVETRRVSEGLQVAQMMVTEFRTIPVHATLSHAAELLLAGEQREFPVVDNLGRAEGLLTRDNLIRGLAQLGPQAVVADAMTAHAPTVSPTLPFAEALERLRASGLPALAVVDAAGTLIGLLTRENIADLILVRRSEAMAASRGH